ncbi:MAG: hypothetical protein ACI88A_001388 [Paraglaciecola sp.]|jgi:hypothetical protein
MFFIQNKPLILLLFNDISMSGKFFWLLIIMFFDTTTKKKALLLNETALIIGFRFLKEADNARLMSEALAIRYFCQGDNSC